MEHDDETLFEIAVGTLNDGNNDAEKTESTAEDLHDEDLHEHR